MNPELDSIGTAIVKGVLNPDAKDGASDLSEIELGRIFGGDLLKEVPVIKIIIACRNSWTAIRDQLFLRKVDKFLTNCPRFTDPEREAFLSEHLTDGQKSKRLADALVLILDRLDDLEKPELLAKFFAAFVRREIDLETFLRMAAAIDIGFIEDLKGLVGNCAFDVKPHLAVNLVRTGLVCAKFTNHPVGIRGEDYHLAGEFTYEATDLGRTFDYLLDPCRQS